MPDTRPGIVFDREGVCMPCRAAQARKAVDWNERLKELKELCDRYRGKNGDYYDCIIAASGGKDSHFQVYVMKELMKMNPFVEMHLPPKIDEYDLKPNDIPLSMGGELVVTPSNYARVIYAGDEDSLEKGKWYFNQAELLLVYVINNTELFTSEIEGSPRIRFRIALDYNDRNGNGQYESTIDEFRNMKLTSIDQYQWN